jgi:hypothetical protein
MKYNISENRLKKLIIRIIKNMNISGLYRVQIHVKNIETNEVNVALFFEFVRNSEFLIKIKNEVERNLSDFLNLNAFVIVIPWSEAEYHLREPRNV